MKLFIAINFCLLSLNSCNHKLLVNKKRIVSSERGYLTFFKDEVVFFPWPDSIDVAFLSKSHENGFKVNEKGIDWLDSIAGRYTIQVSKEMPISVREYRQGYIDALKKISEEIDKQ